MKTVRKLDKTGDTCLQFDETEATAEQRAQAKALFEEHVMKKLPVFSTNRPGGAEDLKITSFDQIEEGAETILVPAIVAG